MKKALSLILALVMCLPLCACGIEGPVETAPETTMPETAMPEITVPETTVPPTTEKPQITELYLNETITLGDFEFTITDVQFVKSFSTSLSQYSTGDGYYYIKVDYIIKNVSKTSKLTPLYCLTVDYNDGYIFDIFKTYRDVAMYNGGVGNPTEMAPLSRSIDCRAYFSVPEEVYTSGKPLSIIVRLSDGEGKVEASFNVRSMEK